MASHPLPAGIAIVIALSLASAAADPVARGVAAPPAVRFHHLHYRVGDPAAAMNAAAAALQGSRVLLRGLGVGVRIGREYVLFDRADAAERPDVAPLSADAIESIVLEWCRAHGVEAAAPGSSRVRLSEAFQSEHLDHIAFTSSDIAAVLAALRSHGAIESRRTEDSTFFHVRDGVTLEIVRDTGVPDAYWCPMHPDVRAGAGGHCPICGMTLVPIPPPRIGEYRMDVAVTPAPGGKGVSRLRLTVRDPATGKPVAAFAAVHERLLHLFIINRALDYFAHVHPTPAGPGVFELRQALPPGEYVLIADFLPQAGTSQTLQRAIVTPGYRGPLFPLAADLTPAPAPEQIVDGLRVRLDATGLTAGKEAVLRFTLADAATGAAVADLEPFLGAPGHMLIVNADLTEADHAHPEEAATRGPVVSFQPRMPAAGPYKLWVQFQRKGRVITVPFVVMVAEP